MLSFLSNAWSEVKIPRKISVKTPGFTAVARKRTSGMDSSPAEANRELVRVYILQLEFNR